MKEIKNPRIKVEKYNKMKKITGIRGATCSDNTKEEIVNYVCQMCNSIIEENDLSTDDIVSIQFSITRDLTALNPATALRTGPMRYDMSNVPLFCSQEPEIEGGMEYVIRVLFLVYINEFSLRHNIYINGAERLRPDFLK